jgi:23S rRNA pseudouridine2604 synthase
MKKNKTEVKKDAFPIRINKYLADRGYSTRRGADDLIKKGVVQINGKKAVLGDIVKENDTVTLSKTTASKYAYYLYHKAVGIVTVGKSHGEREIKDVTKLPDGIFPVGRLDKDSHGLIILTNDGRVTDRLLNPKYDHEKEYRVVLDKPVTHEFMIRLRNGVSLGKNFKTKKADVRRFNSHTIDIVITEGKNRQVRRMCASFNYTVEDLCRIRIMNLELGNLGPNSLKKLTGEKLEVFLKSIGL